MGEEDVLVTIKSKTISWVEHVWIGTRTNNPGIG